MKIFCDVNTGQLRKSIDTGALGPLTFYLYDTDTLEIVFVDGGIPVTSEVMEGGKTLKVGLKAAADSSSQLLAFASDYVIAGNVMSTTLSLNTSELEEYFSDVVARSTIITKAYFEITVEGTAPTFRKTYHLSQCQLSRSVNTPDDVLPSVSPELYLLKSTLFDSSSNPISTGYAGFRREITTRTGGGSGALDAIATVSLSVPLLIQTLIANKLQTWALQTNAVEVADGEYLIQPVDFNASTNPKKWRLVG